MNFLGNQQFRTHQKVHINRSNDIKCQEEKEGGRRRSEGSFEDFQNFIVEMEMGDIKFRGDAYTWKNNRENEGFIKERFDRFLGSVAWIEQYKEAEGKHVFRLASDHNLISLDTNPLWQKIKARFIFESRWANMPESEEMVKTE